MSTSAAAFRGRGHGIGRVHDRAGDAVSAEKSRQCFRTGLVHRGVSAGSLRNAESYDAGPRSFGTGDFALPRGVNGAAKTCVIGMMREFEAERRQDRNNGGRFVF
jgi:hypothetical protein